MLRILIFSLALITFSVAQAQEDNTIKNLEVRIEAAALEGDYAKAANLTKQKELQIELNEAVASKDYEKAAKLKEEIQALEASENSSSSKSKEVVVQSTAESSASQDNLFQSGGFIDALLGISPKNLNTNKPAYGSIAARFGSRWYFGDGSVYRPGLQAMWFKPNFLFNTNGAGVIYEFTLLNLGMTNGIAINDRMGIEANFSLGFTHLITSFNNYSYANGFNITPDVKFRYKGMSVGFDFSNSIFFNRAFSGNSFSVNTYSIAIGGRF